MFPFNSTGEIKCNVTGICLRPERCGSDVICERTAQGFKITVVFNASYSKISGSKDAFTLNFLQYLWNVTNSSCIRDFLAEPGSINVTFTMTPQKGRPTDDLIKKIDKLEVAVKSGDFRVALPSGEVITADANSFKASRITPTIPPTTVANTVATTTESSSNKTTIIIVCSVIGGLLLIVIIIIVVYCRMRKKKQQRITPNSSKAKLQEEVPMKDHPGNCFSSITGFAC